MLKVCFPVALFLLLAFTASHSAAEVRYVVTDLGTTTIPSAINNNGQIVGSLETEGGHEQAFVYQNGTLTELGTFGGADSEATGINTSGKIVGNMTTYTGDSHGFLCDNGFTDLFGTAGIIKAKGINDSGVVLGLINGFYWETSPARQTVLYDNGLLTNISLAEGGDGWDSDPVAINNKGQALFFEHICGDCAYSYLYSEGRLEEYVWFDASDLNDSGHVVGNRPSFSFTQDYLGLWYHDGAQTVLNDRPETDCYPQAINNKEQIVGTLRSDDASYAFLYSGSAMADLNTLTPPSSGWNLVEAIDINDHGQIIGFGMFQGDWHAYLLEPAREVHLDLLMNGGKGLPSSDSNRLLSAAIISSSDFDAATVNPESINLAGATVKKVGQKQRYLADLKDSNGDGLQDLVFRVPVSEVSLDGVSGRLVLEAATFDGQKIYAEATLLTR